MTPTAADHLTVTLNGAEILILEDALNVRACELKEARKQFDRALAAGTLTAEKHDFKMTRLSSKLYKIQQLKIKLGRAQEL